MKLTVINAKNGNAPVCTPGKPRDTNVKTATAMAGRMISHSQPSTVF